MKKRFALFACLLFVLSEAQAQDITSRFQRTLDSIFSAHPGSSGILVHVEAPDQQISWSGASGYSNNETKETLDPRQPALIASSIKTYVSATILRLVEQGKLSIDDPIGPLLTAPTRDLFNSDGYDLSQIQIKHLLSHTSGIYNYANQAYIDRKDSLPNERWTRDRQLALSIEGGDPLGKAGAQFSYADANYLLLTEIIEGFGEEPFFNVMHDLLRFDELGIENTWFPTLEEKPWSALNMAHQYWGEYEWDSYDLDVSWDLYGGGGIACPTKDMALFVQSFFTGKIVEDEATQDLIFTYIPTKETEEHRYYLGLSEDEYHGMKGYGHGGFWGTVMLYFPELNASIAVYVLDRDARILQRTVLDRITAMLKAD